IIGGHIAAEGNWPWLASLSGGCTGSIISAKHVLSAGHCGRGKPENVLIYLGSVDTNKSPVKAAVSNIHLHPTFLMNCTNLCYAMRDDIAIFELAEPLVFTDTVRPVCLPTEYKEVYGEMGFIAGWGTHD
ncbi:serine protease, partial [Aphelenchoides avenae]